MSIAGIDIGTTGCKCTVYNEDGRFLTEAYEEYETIQENGRHELDAGMVWKRVQTVIKRVSQEVSEIEALGVTSFGETFVMTDEQGEPLIPAILYTDIRGEEQCERLKRHFGEETLGRITGVKPHKMFSISKMMWVKEHLPDQYVCARHIMLIGDYIVYKLTGVVQTDDSLASRTMAFDIRKHEWNHEILEFAGIEECKLPKIVRIGSKAGIITTELTGELGLSRGTVVVTGCHDQAAAAIGTGILSQGMAVDGTGTVECMTPMFHGIPENNILYKGSYAIVPYILEDSYLCYAFSFTGGALLKWYRDKLESVTAGRLKEKGQSAYEYFNSQVKDEVSGLLVLPHFCGAATPYMDSESRGAVIGLTTETSSIDIYRALMEGVTYEMLLNMEELRRSGITIENIRATGGGASSEIWLQMKADILNIPVYSLGAAQSGTLGCIMLAGVACNIYPDIGKASDVFVKIRQIYTPRKDKNEDYMRMYKKYKKLYTAIKRVLGEGGAI